jgi:hypothetical protein
VSTGDIIAIISAVAAAAVAIIGAWRGENVRQQLQQHVQGHQPGVHRRQPPSSQ